MANRPYIEGIDNIGNGNVDLGADTFRGVLLDFGQYSPNTGSGGHDALSDIAGGARVSTSGNVTGLSFNGGVWDFNDVTFTGSGGATCEGMAIYKVGGTEATSYLVCLFDTGGGLPFTPPVSNWTYVYKVDNGTNRVFKIG